MVAARVSNRRNCWILAALLRQLEATHAARARAEIARTRTDRRAAALDARCRELTTALEARERERVEVPTLGVAMLFFLAIVDR